MSSKAFRKKKTKQLTLTPNQTKQLARELDRNIDQVKSQAVEDALAIVLAIPIIVLHDDFKFGKGRLQKFLDRFKTHYSCLGETAEIVDMVKLAEELADVRMFEL